MCTDRPSDEMTHPALSDNEIRVLSDSPRRKFAEERWPLSPSLRSVREALEKLKLKLKG
jgi:hypothetical protein